MKKISPYLIAALSLAIISLSSCKDIKPTEVSLQTLNDSINYTLGHWQGQMIKAQQFPTDSTNVQLAAFIEGLDEAYSQEKEDKQMYALGKQVGRYIADQMKNGMFGDSTLVADKKLIIQGLVNAIKDNQDVMNREEADSIVMAAQQRLQPGMSGQPN